MLQADKIERKLCARSLAPLADVLPPGEFVMPDYDGLGIANLPSTLAALLNADLPGACPVLERDLWADWMDGLKRVVLVLFDALGYRQLRTAMRGDDGLIFHKLVEAGRMVPITSTFPSTTCTVMTTFWTGYAPSAHGSLAYEFFLRELGVAVVHARRLDALAEWGLDAETFVPVPGLAEHLVSQGIRTHAMIPGARAGLSMQGRILFRGVQEFDSYVGQGDMWLGLQRAIEKHGEKKLLLTLYCYTLDGITHHVGPDDASWGLELRSLARMMDEGFLSRLTTAQRDGTLLLITADHGGLPTLVQDAVQLQHHPDLRDALLFPPVGEVRVPFLHTRGDNRESVRAYMEERLGKEFVTLTREQVLESGLLGPGPLYVETPHRLGDLVGVARGNYYLAHTKGHLQMKGQHGGLSPQEMLVPLIGVRLDAL